MILSEFTNNQNRKWRKKIFRSCFSIACVILAIELFTCIAYLVMGVMDVKLSHYLELRILFPSVIDFGALFIYKVLDENKRVRDDVKNTLLALVILFLCVVVATFHGFYFILWIAPTMAIFYTTLFNNRNTLKIVLYGALIETTVAFGVSMFEKNFDVGLTFTYLIVTEFFIFCEYLVAAKIIEHHKEQQRQLFEEIAKQEELLEKLDLEPITKLYNRKAFDRHLEEVIENSTKDNLFGEKRFYIIMFDLDHFKLINDTYGHMCGDQVLLGIASILQKYTEGKGRAYRYGGEEFVVILDPCMPIDAFSIAEQIRRILKERTFDFDINRKVTISAGGIWYEKTWDSRKWIEEADKLLYQAKESGRDQTIISPKIEFSNIFK